MAEQRPLVLIAGQIQQLPTGDTVAGSSGTPSEEEIVAYDAEEIDFDDVNDYIYKGWTAEGTGDDTTAAVWRVQRISFIGADGDITKRWAQTTGSPDSTYSHIWDNRVSFTY